MRALACCSLAVVMTACTASPSAQHARTSFLPHAWTRFGFDAARSSSSADPTGITAANITSLRRQQVQLDGIVDASAIYLPGVTVNGSAHNVFFVTTAYGKTIAVDADDGSVLWTFTPAGYDSWAGSYQFTNSTPVADDDWQSLYAASPDGRVQKLSASDGSVLWSTAITQLPQREKIAAPLNYFNGRVIATTGGYVGDAPPYQGHVAVLDGSTGELLHVWNSLCSDRPGLLDPHSCPQSGSAMWGRAGAVVDPSTGNIFVATGNGRWDGRTFWGDAAIELDADATQLVGSYTPTNTDELDSRDLDVGSTSPVLLGGGLLLQGAKDGRMRLLSLEQMHAAPRRGGELQSVSTPSGSDLFTAPAVWRNGDQTWIFAADDGAIEAWIVRDGRLEEKWRGTNGGTSPVVAGGLLYVYDGRGTLRVYEPENGHVVTTLSCGEGHWNSPIVVDGRIALPEGSANSHRTSGVLNIWRIAGSR